MRTGSEIYFGANSGFGMQNAKYCDESVFGDGELQREMAALMKASNPEAGYVIPPDEISEYPRFAEALYQFVSKHFPEQLE